MRKIALITLALLCPLLAHADAPSDASVAALLDANHLKEAVAGVATSAVSFAKAQAAEASKGQDLSDKQKKDLADLTDQFAKKVQTEMTYTKMQAVYSKMYKDNFTQEEIDGLTAFFKSPAGVAYLNKMPQVQQKSQEANRNVMLPLIQQLQKDIVAVIEKK